MFVSATLLLGGCSKNSINIYLGDEGLDSGQTAGGGNSNGSKTLVTFHASIESRNMTRSLSPMRKGLTSRIFAFKNPVTSLEDPSAEGIYVTSSIGILTGVQDYKMYLPNGIYYFFAVSNNTSTTPVDFVNDRSEPLSNGVDYLWASNKAQDVTTSQVTMPILFEHVATQVVFNISAGAGLKLDKLVSATITPSQPGATMDLITGTIPFASAYDAPIVMGVNAFTAQYIMLPLRHTQPMSLVLQILADGETTPRTYTTDVPLPDSQLVGGNSYVFSAVIDGNSVSFPDVEVLNWTEVDETGKPLYPSQKPD